MDAIIRAFWWGHGQGEKKLHLLNWEKICQPKRKGGLRLKKFGPLNQAMLAKQYWNLNHKPNSLLTRTYKAKYYSNCSLQEYIPKPHHSWVWKNIVKHGDFRLREGQWRVGTGFNIPLTYQNWFPCPYGTLDNPDLHIGTVGDLINQNSKSWKADLVRTLYPFPLSKQILQIPLTKTHEVQDKLLWKFSNEGNGNYKVKNAYEVIMQSSHPSWNIHGQQNVWNLIWGVKVPLKINTFVWKLIQDRLPTLLNLSSRGIPTQTSCPLCNSNAESSTHLFLLCPFTRACWHGSTLAILSSDFNCLNVQQWLSSLLIKFKSKETSSMAYLQAIFTTLCHIWLHRNRVLYDGLNPNPMSVILISQSMACRYKETLLDQPSHTSQPRRPQHDHSSLSGQWQLVVKLAGARSRSAYEDITRQGDSLFYGVNSCVAGTANGALLESWFPIHFVFRS